MHRMITAAAAAAVGPKVLVPVKGSNWVQYFQNDSICAMFGRCCSTPHTTCVWSSIFKSFRDGLIDR